MECCYNIGDINFTGASIINQRDYPRCVFLILNRVPRFNINNTEINKGYGIIRFFFPYNGNILGESVAIMNKSSSYIIINEFEYDCQKYILSQGIEFIIEKGDKYISFFNDEYNLYAVGETEEEVLGQLNERFAYVWQEYALEDDINLTPKAIEYKNKLLSLKLRVQPCR